MNRKRKRYIPIFSNISFQTKERGKIRVFTTLLKEIKQTPKPLPTPQKILKKQRTTGANADTITVNFQCHYCTCISSLEKKNPDAFQILMCTVNEAIFSHQCWCKWTLQLNLDNWRSMMTHFIVLSSVAECYDQQIVQTRRPSSPRFSRRGGWRWMGKAINLTK